MTTEPLVSVLMGVYNEKKHLTQAIESILTQTYDDFELLIVDDASTDNSPDIVRSYEDPRITLLENETNQGLTASLNRALEHAEGEFVARQDADDVSEPDRFERQVGFLERNKSVDVVGTGAYLIDGNGTVLDKRVGYCNPTFEDFMDKGHLVHGSVMARRSTLEAVGGYDEFFRYGQDQELWLRLTDQGCKIANIPQPLYRHRIHDEGVYFSRKDESAMYGIVARDLVTGACDPSIKEELSDEGVLAYYDQISPERRASFHADLATRYLRYGHTEPALEECRKARNYRPYAPGLVALSTLAHLGPTITDPVRWGMRRYLNLKTRLSNRFACPYELE